MDSPIDLRTTTFGFAYNKFLSDIATQLAEGLQERGFQVPVEEIMAILGAEKPKTKKAAVPKGEVKKCSAIKNNNQRCERNATAGRDLCSNHYNQANKTSNVGKLAGVDTTARPAFQAWNNKQYLYAMVGRGACIFYKGPEVNTHYYVGQVENQQLRPPTQDEMDEVSEQYGIQTIEWRNEWMGAVKTVGPVGIPRPPSTGFAPAAVGPGAVRVPSLGAQPRAIPVPVPKTSPSAANAKLVSHEEVDAFDGVENTQDLAPVPHTSPSKILNSIKPQNIMVQVPQESEQEQEQESEQEVFETVPAPIIPRVTNTAVVRPGAPRPVTSVSSLRGAARR